MYDTSAYWQAQLINWGPRILIAIVIVTADTAPQWIYQGF